MTVAFFTMTIHTTTHERVEWESDALDQQVHLTVSSRNFQQLKPTVDIHVPDPRRKIYRFSTAYASHCKSRFTGT